MSIEVLSCQIIKSLGENAENVSIEIGANITKEGVVGDLVSVSLKNKKNEEERSVIFRQQKCENGKPITFTNELFENEIYFYETIWPKLQEMFEIKTGKTLDIVPNCLASSKHPIKFLIMENLTTRQFKLFDKTKNFDDEHLNLVFKTFGVFHGISMALKEQEQESFLKLVEPIHHVYRKQFENPEVIGKSFKQMAGFVQSYFDTETEGGIIEKLRLYEQAGPRIIADVLTRDINDGVILHGDCWNNNLMFKYSDNGKPEEVKLIDFQQVYSGSPVYDLSLCLYTSSSEESLRKLEYYLKTYHSSLSHTVNELGFDVNKIYSMKKLWTEWKKYSKYGFAMALVMWRFKLAEEEVVEEASTMVVRNCCPKEPLRLTNDKELEYKLKVRYITQHMYENNFL